MSSTWLASPGAINKVKLLLERAGIPLELSVANIAQQFCSSRKRGKLPVFSSQKVVYSQSRLDPVYREVDRLVQIYDEFEVGDHLGIQLIFNMTIECKFREDIEIFGFSSHDIEWRNNFPLHSDLQGSRYFTRLNTSLDVLNSLDAADIATMEIKNGQTPQKIHAENLIYNAAGSLYDFVAYDLAPHGGYPEKWSDKIIDDLGILKSFQSYVNKKSYDWRHVVHDWAKNITKDKLESFNKRYFGKHRLFHHVSVHLPIVCVNGPIHKVTWASSTGIERFTEIPYFTTSVRKAGWPGTVFTGLLTRNL